jgi:hypothetical protein
MNQVKITKPHVKDKERKETNTRLNVYPVRSKLTYYGGEIDLFNPLSMSCLQRDIKALQKISFKNSQRTSPNFYLFFPISQMDKTLNDFHSSKVFTNVSQLKRTFTKDPQS